MTIGVAFASVDADYSRARAVHGAGDAPALVGCVQPNAVSLGKPATVRDLRKGMKVQAAKIVEEAATEISTKVTVTGKAPK